MELLNQNEENVEIKVSTFKLRDAAREHNIYDISEFLSSKTFRIHFLMKGDSIYRKPLKDP